MTASAVVTAKDQTIRRRKLWIKVLVPLFAIVLFVLVSVIVYNIDAQETMIDKQVTDQNTLLAHTVNNAIFDALSTGENDLVRSQFARLKEKLPGVRIYVYDFNGIVSFSTEGAAIGDSMDRIFEGEAAAGMIGTIQGERASASSITRLRINGETLCANHLPIFNENACHHCHGQSHKRLGGITVVSSMDSLLSALRTARNKSIAMGMTGLLILGLSIYFLFFFLVNKPVQLILNLARNLRQGDFTSQIETRRGDELSHILNRLNLVSREMRGIFRNFTKDSDLLAESSERLAGISESLKAEAESTSEQSRSVAESTGAVSGNMKALAGSMEQTAANISTVSSSSEELLKTIGEIAQSAGKAQSVIGKVSDHFSGVSGVVRELGMAAEEIDAVTDSIREVSEQVNLLALNATIEAARAGEAGRGFAVVAQEIKKLARQASAATNDADEKLHWMQSKTGETVTKIEQVAAIIVEAGTSIGTIAAAVEQQSTSTREIADSMAKASDGIAAINAGIAGTARESEQASEKVGMVDTSTRHILTGSEAVNQQAADLSTLAGSIKRAVHRFKI